jgi:hypothetical protein
MMVPSKEGRMKPRLSILGLMGVIVFVAVGFAALRYPTELWASVIFTLAGLILLVAVVKVVHQEGPGRSFWLGFSVFGWGHLLLAFWSSIGFNSTPHLVPFPKLLTSRLADVVLLSINPGHGNTNLGIYWRMVTSSGTFEPVLQISHCLLSLLVALIGGIVTARFLRDDQPRP